MNIAIIACGYPSKEEPQFGCFEKDQALALKKAGHEVSIIYVDGRFRRFKRKVGITHFVENGINVYGIYLYPGAITAYLNRRLHCWLAKKMLGQVFAYLLKKQRKPDIIYAHYLDNIHNATFLKEKYNIPLVGIEHWSRLNAEVLPSDILNRGRRAYSLSDKVLAVSVPLRQSIHRFWGIEPWVVHDMLSDEFMQETTIRQQKKRKSINFITIGSLIYRKRIDLLISAFYNSALAMSGSKLLIIGDGIERKHLQKQVGELGIDESVVFLGRKNKTEIIEYLKKSDVFVLSSQCETFSVVCIEAMSLGLPVIATKCGGPETFIDKECGLLVSINNEKELSSALKYMSENSSQYDSVVISNRCKQRFAPSVIAKQLTDIFEEVVAEHNSMSK